jgi:YHS domain-containing protein
MKRWLIFFIIAVAVSLLAASHRWNDSAHAITTVSNKGGSVRHAVELKGGEDRYTIVVTSTVIPPYRGDIKMALEGEPQIPYEIRSSLPPRFNLGVHKWYSIEGDIVKSVKPRDKFILWLILKPNPVDPVCGMEGKEEITESYSGKRYRFCREGCREEFRESPEKFRDNDYMRGKYNLVFYDTKTDKPVLNLPIILKDKNEKETEGSGHH